MYHTYSAVGDWKVLFRTIAKPGIFLLGMTLKENFLSYSTQFIFLITRLLPRNVVIVAIDICGKSSHHEGVNIWNNVKTCLFNNIFTVPYP